MVSLTIIVMASSKQVGVVNRYVCLGINNSTAAMVNNEKGIIHKKQAIL